MTDTPTDEELKKIVDELVEGMKKGIGAMADTDEEQDSFDNLESEI